MEICITNYITETRKALKIGIDENDWDFCYPILSAKKPLKWALFAA